LNIFTALSQGKGSLNENNMSAMLSYLLNSHQDHGLKDTFLKKFLKLLDDITDKKLFPRSNNILGNRSNLNVEVTLEPAYDYKGNRRYLDIELQVYDNTYNYIEGKNEVEEILRIAIENKIKPSSAQNNQFKEEYEAVKSEIENKETKILMVFLTPYGDYNNLQTEYDNLIIDESSKNEKVWLKWDAPDNENTVVYLIKSLLKNEANFKIDPISDYVRNTLKAFIRHIIETNIKFTSPEIISDDLGDIKNVVNIELKSGKYRVEEYESSSIKIYNVETQEYEVAKPILRDIIEEKNLKIDLYYDSGNKKNTRTLGKDVIQSLKKKNIKPYFSTEEKLNDKNKIINTIDINLNNSKYRVEEYQNGSIKIYNKTMQKYEAAHPLLKKIIKEKGLDINLNYESGNEKNTRSLGKSVIQALK
jgi:antitoxin component of RelBE/YafQ-DinJ toxin-antitoxin module